MGLMDSLGGGGLDKVLDQLKAGGLGEQVQSWIGKDGNLPISADQIEKVLGSGPIGDLAAKLGLDPHTAAAHISSALPGIIDQLTPDGKVPESGLGGGLGDVLGGLGKNLPGGLGEMLGGILKR